MQGTRAQERLSWTMGCLLGLLVAASAASGQVARGSTRIEVSVAQELTLREYHALVIGINDYSDLVPLETAVNDAQAVAEMLRDDYGFQVVLQLNPTRSDILGELLRMRKQLTSQTSLLIYYAGHGYLDEETEIGYWLPVDAAKDNPANWIANEDVTRQLAAFDAHHVMIVADSCYSATLTRDAGIDLDRNLSREQWLRRMSGRRSRTAMTSGGIEPVADGGGDGHSVFAKAFLDSLRDNNSILDGTTLFDRVKMPVVTNADQTPSYANIRKANHDGGDFLFIPRSAMGLGPAGPGGSLTLTEVTDVRGTISRASTSTSRLAPTPVTTTPSATLRPLAAPSGPQGPSWIDSDTLNRAIRLAGGEFRMGEKGSLANEAPVRTVRLSPFYLQQKEVTNAEYLRFYDRHRFMPGAADSPVIGLTWDEAREYAQWLGGDLPSEAQWEFAARGREGREYPWGSSAPSCERANSLECGRADVKPTGGHPKGATPDGILDLAGNAPEWVLDWFGSYSRGGSVDPSGPEVGSQKVMRGGSFGMKGDALRGAHRLAMAPDIRGGVGFRVAWSEPQYLAASGRATGDTLASLD